MTKKNNKKPIVTVVPPQVVKNSAIEKNRTSKSKFSLATKLSIILGVLSFLLYANTLQNGYAMDDSLVITQNKFVKQGIKAIPTLLSTPHLKGHGNFSNDTYRPLSLVMFAIENDLFDSNPIAGHFFNILVYVGCVIMLFLFFDKIFERKKTVAAFISALLFAIHPVHTEVVANIKSRDELMCFLFACGSLYVFMVYARDGKLTKLLAGALLLFLSFISKETVITFIVVIPLIFFFYLNENKKRSIYITACSVAVAIIFIALRALVLKTIHLPSNSSAFGFLDNQLVNVPATASRFATELVALGYYIRLLFIPYPLLSNYSYNTIPFVSFNNPWALLSLVVYLFLTVFGIYRLIKVKKDPWAFGVLFFLITLSLFSNILFLVGEILAERFVFFASAGFCLLAALAIEKWWINANKGTETDSSISTLIKPKVLILLVLLVLIFGNITIARNKDWENDYKLFKADVINAPRNSRLPISIGNVLISNLNNEKLRPEVRTQMMDRVIMYMENSLAIYPDNADPHIWIGQLYLRKKMFDSAEIQEKLALELSPQNVSAMNNLASVYFQAGKFQQALPLYKKTLLIDSDDVVEYKNIGLCYFYMNVYDSAITSLKRALQFPENYEANAQIAFVYKTMGKMDSALKYEAKMKQYQANFRIK